MRTQSYFYSILFITFLISCNSPEPEKTIHPDSFKLMEAGQNIAIQTKAVLGENLTNAIETKGTAAAVTFCSEKAKMLTDSMATKLNVRIKRVSDNYRNPGNNGNTSEITYIQEAKKKIINGEIVKPQLTIKHNKATGFYPIMTNQMCLQCHGQVGTDIAPTTYINIQKFYPNDKATGYGINELRGIWVIEMDTAMVQTKM